MSMPPPPPPDRCGPEGDPAAGDRSDRRDGPRRRWRLRALVGGERGQSTAEYLGVILLIAAIVAALVVGGFGPLIARGIERAICLITEGPGASCGAVTNRASEVKCLTDRQTRQFGYNVTAFSVRADRSLNDRLSVYGGDAPSTVTLYEGSGAGVEGMVGVKEALEASGHVSLLGEVGYQYEFDGEEGARDFLEERRGGLERYAELGLPGSTTVQSGMDFLRQKVGPALGCESCASDEHVPDKLVAKVGVRGQGNVGLEGGRAGAAAQATLTETGTVSYDVDTGERTFQVGLKGNGVAAGGLQSNQLPVELKGMLGGTASGSMQVKFDAEGEPQTLVMTTKTGYSYGGEAGLKGEGTSDLSVSEQRGNLDVKQARLDLTVPENRAAFEGVFQPVGGTAMIPKAQSPDAYVDNVRRLAKRYAEDGLFVRSTYDRDGSGGSGEVKSVDGVGGRGIKGGEGLTFGAGGLDDATVVSLREAEIMDRRNPGTGWQPLPSCDTEE